MKEGRLGSLPLRGGLGTVSMRPAEIALVALSLFGLGVAAYLTTVHYASLPLVCSASGLVNCEQVLTSPYSVLPGTAVPITILGMGWFVVNLVMVLASVRIGGRIRWQRWSWIRLVWAGSGMIAVFYLIFVEVVRLHAICLWCSLVHLTVFTILLTDVWLLMSPSEPA